MVKNHINSQVKSIISANIFNNKAHFITKIATEKFYRTAIIEE